MRMPFTIQPNQVLQILNLVSASTVLERSREVAKKEAESIIGEKKIRCELGSASRDLLRLLFRDCAFRSRSGWRIIGGFRV